MGESTSATFLCLCIKKGFGLEDFKELLKTEWTREAKDELAKVIDFRRDIYTQHKIRNNLEKNIKEACGKIETARRKGLIFKSVDDRPVVKRRRGAR